jgi:hypothetical protein
MTVGASGAQSACPPFNAYQRRLLAFPGVATFFAGYDFFAPKQVTPTPWDLIGHIGYVASPIVVGRLAADGVAFPALALGLLLWLLAETICRELERTSELEAPP